MLGQHKLDEIFKYQRRVLNPEKHKDGAFYENN